jgi:hypothetical protein
MTISRNLSILAEGASASGVLATTNGGTGSTSTQFVNLTTNVTGILPVANGGTGATSNAAAPFALKGSNSDITALSGLTTALSVGQGGTGLTTVGTNGQVLQSNGSALVFATPATTSPAGSTGQIQYNNAGAFGAVSSGTSGQVLTSAGSGAAPTWSTPSAGAMTLISTQSTTSGTSVSFTGLSGYDKYYLVAEDINFSGSETKLSIYIGYGATPTYITSGYSTQGNWSYGGTTGSRGNNNISSGFLTNFGNTQGNPMFATATIAGTNNLTANTAIFSNGTMCYLPSGGVPQYYTGSSMVANGGNAITAFQLFFDGGSSFTSGKISLYGISS